MHRAKEIGGRRRPGNAKEMYEILYFFKNRQGGDAYDKRKSAAASGFMSRFVDCFALFHQTVPIARPLLLRVSLR